MNSNYNQQFNYQIPNNQFNNQSFGNSPNSPNFDQQQLSFAGASNSFQSNLQSNSFSTAFETFRTPNSFCQQVTNSSMRFRQFSSGSDQFNNMGENMFNQSSSSITPTNSPSFQVTDFGDSYVTDEHDLVQNYGPRDSDEYREKRNRNNLAVRKARKKFQKKNQEVQERLVKLRNDHEVLIQQKKQVQRAFEEIKDLHDQVTCFKN